MKETKITALYERVATKDRLSEESYSITIQKELLEDYATAHGFGNIVHFTDDGFTADIRSDADRPGFARMMSEIEAGNVGVCICRDMSRLGRGIISIVGCIVTMMANGVRLIAVVDSYDSNKDEDEWKTLRSFLDNPYNLYKRSSTPSGK